MTTDNFDEIIAQYGTTEQIPNDILYDFLISNRQNLINLSKMGTDQVPKSTLGREVRRRSETDLFWLARYFTWETNPASDNGTKPITENWITEEYYKVVCDLFVQKDKSKPLNEQSEIKTRLLLWPRSGMKSTIDHVDTIQWILNFPHIRILYLTAEVSLAEGFVDEVKGHFLMREDAEEKTLMELFFPEFCFMEVSTEDVKVKKQKKNLFTCPVWANKKIKRKEPTVVASSVGKTKSGWHYELIKMDDAVSDTNSETSEQCVSISHKLSLAEKLIIPGGYYVDYIGTRYADEDHYGTLLEKNENVGEVVRLEGQGWYAVYNKTTNMKILVGRAIQIKPEVAEKLRNEGRPVTYQEAGEDGCVLLLPHIMSFSWLMNDLAKDEKSFEGQRNQNPRTAGQVVFDRVTLLRATIPYNLLPRAGPVSVFWDLSFSEKKGVDYCVGSSVMWGEEDLLLPDGKKTGNKKTVGYVKKLVRKRFNPFTAAQAIVQMVVEERPFIMGIEDAGGSKNLDPTIRAEAIKTGDPHVIAVCSNIEWVTPSNVKEAKKIRMGALLPWLTEGRMKFLNVAMQPEYQNLDPLYSEFEKCMTSHHHDDIPDNLGYQPRYAPQATQAIVENNVSMFSRIDQMGWGELFIEGYQSPGNGQLFQTDSEGNIIYHDPYAAVLNPDDFMPEPEIVITTPHGLPNILGAGLFG